MEFKEIFEEWDVYARKKQLLDRDFNKLSVINNANKKIIAITGIRRCGKSSLLMLFERELIAGKEKVAYINMEDSRISGKEGILDEVLKWFGDDGFLLLDEITAIRGWEGWLARVHEQLKGKLKLIVTSSRTSMIHPSKPLRGRILHFELFPLSFKEYLSFKNIVIDGTIVNQGKLENTLNEYIRYGGFPEVALANEEIDKIRYLESYFKDIIGLDIAEVTGDNINVVEMFARYAIESSYFSASKCLNFFKTLGYKIGKEKLLKLESYSSASYLFFFVKIFSYNIKDKSQYPRKVYNGDTGFYYSSTGKKDLGIQFENLIFIELRRRQKLNEEICYWKNKDGTEVDFVIKTGSSITKIIQASYDVQQDDVKKREIKGALASSNEFHIKTALIITKDLNAIEHVDGIEIQFIPIIKWLLSS